MILSTYRTHITICQYSLILIWVLFNEAVYLHAQCTVPNMVKSVMAFVANHIYHHFGDGGVGLHTNYSPKYHTVSESDENA